MQASPKRLRVGEASASVAVPAPTSSSSDAAFSPTNQEPSLRRSPLVAASLPASSVPSPLQVLHKARLAWLILNFVVRSSLGGTDQGLWP
jgi:hypothetical protein